MQRLKDHRALQASLTLAQQALDFTYEPLPGEIRVKGWQFVATQIEHLKSAGVTAEVLFARVAELVAFLQDHPEACRTRREEDFAIARAVLHIVRWRGVGQGQGASMLAAVGTHLREYLVGPALAFVRRLAADQGRAAELRQTAVAFD